MANASDFLIGANDEHGLNPPTAGKRTPIMPYIGRSFYENEFNREAKLEFILACLRCGFNVYDVHPEVQDISVSARVVRARRANISLLVTFAYNAFGDGSNFNASKGLEVYYSPFNPFPKESEELSRKVFDNIAQFSGATPRFVGRLSVGVLSNVNCPSTLIEAGFMTNFEEAKLMLNPNYVLGVAEGTCSGVCEFLGVQYVARDIGNYPTLRINSNGKFVLILQYLLNRFGYDVSIDGIFGSNTLRAVENFQRDNKLSADGVVGRNTWNDLLNINPTSKVLSRGDRNSAVWYLQKLLLSYLYPITTVDGVFGPETERAVRAFQTENGLVVDGVVGRNTWNSLISSTGRPNPN